MAVASSLILGLTAVTLTVAPADAFIRLPRGTAFDLLRFPRGSAFAGSGAYAGPGGFTSTSTTNVAPGPGGIGNFNAFATNSGPPGFVGGATRTGGGVVSTAGFPAGFNPFQALPHQYGNPYPFPAFPRFPAPFEFFNMLNGYFQQAAQHAQEAAASGNGIYLSQPGGTVWAYTSPNTRGTFAPLFLSGAFGPESNEVGGTAVATYSPQGGYGSAKIFPAPEGAVVTRFGGDEPVQNTLGPVHTVTGTFGPPRGNTFGLFSSSVAGSSNINGKTTSYKQSTIGVNDNGKVTTYTAHD